MTVIEHHLQARDTDAPLVLDVAPDMGKTGRLVAELYALADGRLAMVDVGWAVPNNPGHPIHVLPAPDAGPNVFEPPDESYRIRPIIPNIEPELVDQWARWRSVRAELDATRERARRVVEQLLGPTEPDPQA